MRKIRFLQGTLANSTGEVVTVREETEGEVYYYDSCRRWCYLLKSDEGKTFEFVKQRVRST